LPNQTINKHLSSGDNSYFYSKVAVLHILILKAKLSSNFYREAIGKLIK